MKRVLALVLSASTLCALGCLGQYSYEKRLETTLENLKYQQRLDAYLNPAAQGALKDVGVYVRPPRPLEKAPGSLIPVTAGTFDAAESFTGAQADVPLQLHVLARLKQKPKAQPKQGQAPPPDAPRGNFVADVQAVLNSFYGGAVPVGGKLDNFSERNRSYRRQKFASPTGNTVDVYFFEEGNHQAALVWDIPPAAAQSPAVDPGIRLTLGSFAAGPKATNLFQGGDEDAPASGGGAAVPGVAF